MPLPHSKHSDFVPPESDHPRFPTKFVGGVEVPALDPANLQTGEHRTVSPVDHAAYNQLDSGNPVIFRELFELAQEDAAVPPRPTTETTDPSLGRRHDDWERRFSGFQAACEEAGLGEMEVTALDQYYGFRSEGQGQAPLASVAEHFSETFGNQGTVEAVTTEDIAEIISLATHKLGKTSWGRGLSTR